MQKILTCLWYDNQAEEAVQFYTSIFKNSKIGKIAYYSNEGPGQKGTVLTITFSLDGEEYLALNGGPVYKFTPAVSLFVNCANQEEIDYYWERLSEGGEKGQCGWLTDKFGVSWQIVPTILGEMISDKDSMKVERVTHVMLQMNKLDIQMLKRAYDQG